MISTPFSHSFEKVPNFKSIDSEQWRSVDSVNDFPDRLKLFSQVREIERTTIDPTPYDFENPAITFTRKPKCSYIAEISTPT
ncbi:hypothetical protein PCASD_00376 [Puccinia coronata f. sp. avenae]|uniref:Uncharacterized protein n=1 Tax=Puccinia coronata f. sp. avenae TaxID=200324 RepID=A0A2N5VN31_9BASI|nr:hypothetical protein PCASD_05241 [Puccinia coronata f. sp. avenae]PLW51394.1 hypothetical protein PCASD_00376 [Puccinia coronata f. sp. avenae]